MEAARPACSGFLRTPHLTLWRELRNCSYLLANPPLPFPCPQAPCPEKKCTKLEVPVASPRPTYHLLDIAHSRLATVWPHRNGSGSSPGGRSGHPHRSVPGCRGASHRVHKDPLPQPEESPRIRDQLHPEPSAKASHSPKPSPTLGGLQTGLWILPPWVWMAVLGVHWAQRQGTPQYLKSQPLPKEGMPG